METIYVTPTSRASTIADALCWALRNQTNIRLEAFGPMAARQAGKAITLARAYLAPEGLEIESEPYFLASPTSTGTTESVAGFVLTSRPFSSDIEPASSSDEPLELAIGA